MFLVSRRVGRLCCFLGLGVLLYGCGGGGNPFDMAPVSGKVTYEDGSVIPAVKLYVTFHPQRPPIDQKTHARPAMADVNVADGTFSAATSWQPDDGAVLGRHKVTVVSYDEQSRETGAVPAEYRNPDTSPLAEVEIASGQNRFEFKVKKPSQ